MWFIQYKKIEDDTGKETFESTTTHLPPSEFVKECKREDSLDRNQMVYDYQDSKPYKRGGSTYSYMITYAVKES